MEVQEEEWCSLGCSIQNEDPAGIFGDGWYYFSCPDHALMAIQAVLRNVSTSGTTGARINERLRQFGTVSCMGFIWTRSRATEEMSLAEVEVRVRVRFGDDEPFVGHEEVDNKIGGIQLNTHPPGQVYPANWLPGTNPVAEKAASGSAIGDARFAEWQRPRIEKLIRIFDDSTVGRGASEVGKTKRKSSRVYCRSWNRIIACR